MRAVMLLTLLAKLIVASASFVTFACYKDRVLIQLLLAAFVCDLAQLLL